MTEAIITALITGGLTLIGTTIVTVFNNNKTIYRIEQLEKKQDRYNNLQERTLANEKDIKHIYHEIDQLTEDVKR